MKKRPIKTKTPVLFSPPVYKTIEETSEIQALKEKAKREDPLTKATTAQLEELLYVLNQEKKGYARDHRYKEGLKCNNTIAYVTKQYEIAKKKENQDAAREVFTEVNNQFEESFKIFDDETKKLEKDLLEDQKKRRALLTEAKEKELNDFDSRWNSDIKQRLYNRSTNNLNSLRRQLSFLLVDSNFKDAESVQKQVNERTQLEAADHHEIMQSDHDTALKFLIEKQQQEIQYFEDDCAVELEKLRQDRTKLRQAYLNRQLKLKTKEEIIADPDKLWKHGQTERMGNTLKTSISNGVSVSPSSKMKRADIKETDTTVLVLPPLDNRRKPQKKTTKPNSEE